MSNNQGEAMSDAPPQFHYVGGHCFTTPLYPRQRFPAVVPGQMPRLLRAIALAARVGVPGYMLKTYWAYGFEADDEGEQSCVNRVEFIRAYKITGPAPSFSWHRDNRDCWDHLEFYSIVVPKLYVLVTSPYNHSDPERIAEVERLGLTHYLPLYNNTAKTFVVVGSRAALKALLDPGRRR